MPRPSPITRAASTRARWVNACGKLPSWRRARVVLLGEEADVVAEVEQPLEELPRLVVPALERQHFGEPERAGEEHALARGQPVHLAVAPGVAQHEPVDRELALDRLDRRDDPRIVRRQEAEERHQQHARVELVRAVGLGERLLRLAPGALEHLAPGSRPASSRQRSTGPSRPNSSCAPHGAVERDPGHHLRVREVAVRPAHLPDPGVLAPPAVLEPVEQLPRAAPRCCRPAAPRARRVW